MKRELKLKITKEYADALGEWVECEDLDGMRWILSRMAYNAFKNTGLLYTPKAINKAIQDLLGGKNYASLSTKERHRVLTKTLEIFAGMPMGHMFPVLGGLSV
jgi:hypothetical protein